MTKFIKLQALKLPDIEDDEETEQVVGFSEKQKSKPKKKKKQKLKVEIIPIILPIDCITSVALVDNEVWIDTIDNKSFQLVDDFNYISKRLKAK